MVTLVSRYYVTIMSILNEFSIFYKKKLNTIFKNYKNYILKFVFLIIEDIFTSTYYT